MDAFKFGTKIHEVTYCSCKGNESLIDHDFASRNLSVLKSGVLTCDRDISDHYATYIVIRAKDIARPRRIIIKYRNFACINYQDCFNQAKELSFLPICCDDSKSLDHSIKEFYSLISNLIKLMLQYVHVGYQNP